MMGRLPITTREESSAGSGVYKRQDCGGECSCATCHVVIDPAWAGKLGAISDQESSMLDLNPDREERSRLSCQLPMTEALDGMIVNLPEFQY